jgi:hypothetical protein
MPLNRALQQTAGASLVSVTSSSPLPPPLQHESGDYVKWFVEHLFLFVPAQAIVGQHLQTFRDFPPRQKPGSFSVGEAMDMLMKGKSSN